jgi:hypothetical protein
MWAAVMHNERMLDACDLPCSVAEATLRLRMYRRAVARAVDRGEAFARTTKGASSRGVDLAFYAATGFPPPPRTEDEWHDWFANDGSWYAPRYRRLMMRAAS